MYGVLVMLTHTYIVNASVLWRQIWSAVLNRLIVKKVRRILARTQCYSKCRDVSVSYSVCNIQSTIPVARVNRVNVELSRLKRARVLCIQIFSLTLMYVFVILEVLFVRKCLAFLGSCIAILNELMDCSVYSTKISEVLMCI